MSGEDEMAEKLLISSCHSSLFSRRRQSGSGVLSPGRGSQGSVSDSLGGDLCRNSWVEVVL